LTLRNIEILHLKIHIEKEFVVINMLQALQNNKVVIYHDTFSRKDMLKLYTIVTNKYKSKNIINLVDYYVCFNKTLENKIIKNEIVSRPYGSKRYDMILSDAYVNNWICKNRSTYAKIKTFITNLKTLFDTPKMVWHIMANLEHVPQLFHYDNLDQKYVSFVIPITKDNKLMGGTEFNPADIIYVDKKLATTSFPIISPYRGLFMFNGNVLHRGTGNLTVTNKVRIFLIIVLKEGENGDPNESIHTNTGNE
jgi:hypothetical protein